jgi:hypothetical protein
MKKLIALFAFVLLSGFAFAATTADNTFTLGVTCPDVSIVVGTGNVYALGSFTADGLSHNAATGNIGNWTVTGKVNYKFTGTKAYMFGAATTTDIASTETWTPVATTGTQTGLIAFADQTLCNQTANVSVTVNTVTVNVHAVIPDAGHAYTIVYTVAVAE